MGISILDDSEQSGPASGHVIHAITQGTALGRAPRLVQTSAVAVLKFLMVYEQGALHFYFSWAPQITGLVLRTGVPKGR